MSKQPALPSYPAWTPEEPATSYPSWAAPAVDHITTLWPNNDRSLRPAPIPRSHESGSWEALSNTAADLASPPRHSTAPQPLGHTGEAASHAAPPSSDFRAAYVQKLQELLAARAQMLAETETQLLRVATTIAAAIVGRELQNDPGLYLDLVRHTLSEVRSAASCKLRVSPEGYAIIASTLGGPVIEVQDAQAVLVADPSIDGFGCIAETDDALIDARLESRLDQIRRHLHSASTTDDTLDDAGVAAPGSIEGLR